MTDEIANTEKDRPRRWWIAALLSYLAPGLGQVYNGQATRGLLLYCLYSVWASILFISTLNAMKHDFPRFTVQLIFFFVLILFFILVFIIFDAYRYAKQTHGQYHLKAYNRWVIYVVAAFVVQGVLYSVKQTIRDMIIRPYRITSVSMSPTIRVGDFLLNNKLFYSTNNIRRGDVVFLKYPRNETVTYIKRVVGLPGDTLRIRDKVVYINGSRLDEPYVRHGDSLFFTERSSRRDNLGPLIVPPDHYFVMGDNRDRSFDSRFWGAVAREKIKGKAGPITWSWEGSFPFIRFGRIGRKIM